MYMINDWPCYSERPLSSDSYVRILHASPDAPPVDIYSNGNLIAKNLSYKQLTNYVPVKPQEYKVEVFPAGRKTNSVISTRLAVPPKSSFTVAAVGMLSDISFFPIMEIYMPMPDKRGSFVRFVNLSPNTPVAIITMTDGAKLFSDVGYKDYTDYIYTPPGVYTLEVIPEGQKNAALTVPNVKLDPGTVYTIYVVGLMGERPPLDAIISVDGN